MVETPPQRRKSGGYPCGCWELVHAVDDPELKQQLNDIIDGTSDPALTPIQVQQLAADNGFRLRTATVRRHRHRITKTRECCSCPVSIL